MGRIIPWDLPKINGGSVGGYTPEPIPTPEPTPEPEVVGPYGFDDVVFTLSTSKLTYGTSPTVVIGTEYSIPAGTNTAYAQKIKPSVGISGVKIYDATNVNQVIAHCKIPKEAWEIDYGASTGRVTTVDYDFDIDVSTIMSTIGGAVTKNLTSPFVYGVGEVAGKATMDIVLPVGSLALKSIQVFGSNGVVLQEYFPEVEE